MLPACRLRRLRDLQPLRHCGDTPAPTATGDYAPRASHFYGAQRAKFVVNSDYVVWWGYQGRTLKDSPYWQHMNDLVLSRLPAPDSDLTEAGLNGSYFPAVGNHEVWDDPIIEGVLSATPYLKDLGVSADNMIYTFDFNGVRFITLWTGKFDRHAPSGWDATAPSIRSN